MHISYPLSFPNLRPKAKHCKYFCKNCCTLCASPLITMGPISSFHVSIIIGVLNLDGNSSLMLEVEDTPCNCYKVDMGTSTLEAPVPCAFKVPSTSSNKYKILDAKNLFEICFPRFKHGLPSRHPSPFPSMKNSIVAKDV